MEEKLNDKNIDLSVETAEDTSLFNSAMDFIKKYNEKMENILKDDKPSKYIRIRDNLYCIINTIAIYNTLNGVKIVKTSEYNHINNKKQYNKNDINTLFHNVLLYSSNINTVRMHNTNIDFYENLAIETQLFYKSINDIDPSIKFLDSSKQKMINLKSDYIKMIIELNGRLVKCGHPELRIDINSVEEDCKGDELSSFTLPYDKVPFHQIKKI
jgi:hypothetical protein